MSFTAKKRAYVEARLAGKNIQDSAIAAGYSADTARQSGSRLEKDKDVIAAFARHEAGQNVNNDQHQPVTNETVKKPLPPPKKKKADAPAVSVENSDNEAPDWVKMLAPPKTKKTSKDVEETRDGLIVDSDDPLEFMRQMMKNVGEDPRLRLEAAKSLAAYTLSKPGEKGKKEEQADAAKGAARKFGTIPPPKMQLVKK